MPIDITPESLSDREFVIRNAFPITQFLCARSGSADRETLQEMVLRLLEYREQLGECIPILDGLVRELGLFPFLVPENLGFADSLAYEFHRPDNMNSDVVFHRPQAKVYRELVSGKNIVLSAPTSFGKSLIIDAIINSGRFTDILIIVPTIALIDETRRRLSLQRIDYKIITHAVQARAVRNVFILTQERALELSDLERIQFFVVDEFYKLSSLSDGEDRGILLNQIFYKLVKQAKQFYMLGPHIEGLKQGLTNQLNCDFLRESYHTVVSELHRVEQKPGQNEFERLNELCQTLKGPTLIFCSSPGRAARVARALVSSGVTSRKEELNDAIDWISEHYHPDWHVSQALRHGIGVHHGRIPRALSQFMVRAFDAEHIAFLVCTSTLIEGVNTKAKNVIIFDNTIAKEKYDYFTFNNIRGRSGRMFKHFIGHVYLFHDPPTVQLPLVDIPAFTQPATASKELLLQLANEDLTQQSRTRLKSYVEQDHLSYDTLRSNVGIDLDGQLEVAMSISADISKFHRMMCWQNMPTYEQLEFVSAVIWDSFKGASLAGRSVRSAKQLAYMINQLRSKPSAHLLIESRLSDPDPSEPDDPHTIDRAVTDVLDFIRMWAMYHFPRLLRAVDRIQQDVFARFNLRTGDYSSFATKVENLFVDSSLIALDEYGVPLELARKLETRLSTNGDLDATLVILKSLNLAKLNLTRFEFELLKDAQEHLKNASI
ncbi:MAG: DEAD/DEAH box helicase [Cyanobacteria bacterium SZAS-4]|nr:DEAD/DEAH box helicase [Cyanobacteria bacterium SZAS-4]